MIGLIGGKHGPLHGKTAPLHEFVFVDHRGNGRLRNPVPAGWPTWTSWWATSRRVPPQTTTRRMYPRDEWATSPGKWHDGGAQCPEGRSCPAPDDHCQRICSMQMSWRCGHAKTCKPQWAVRVSDALVWSCAGFNDFSSGVDSQLRPTHRTRRTCVRRGDDALADAFHRSPGPSMSNGAGMRGRNVCYCFLPRSQSDGLAMAA